MADECVGDRVVSGTTDADLARSGWAAYSKRFPATVAQVGAGVAGAVMVRILLSGNDNDPLARRPS